MSVVSVVVQAVIGLLQAGLLYQQNRIIGRSAGQQRGRSQSFMRKYWPMMVMTVLVVMVWVPFVVSHSTAVPDKDQLMLTWSGGALNGCSVTVNANKLDQYANTHNAVALCGIDLPGVDRFRNAAISVSTIYHIEGAAIQMAMPISAPMQQAIDTQKLIAKTQHPDEKNLAITFGLWYEVVLLPKDVNATQIHDLSDVEKLKGIRFPERPGSLLSVPIS